MRSETKNTSSSWFEAPVFCSSQVGTPATSMVRGATPCWPAAIATNSLRRTTPRRGSAVTDGSVVQVTP